MISKEKKKEYWKEYSKRLEVIERRKEVGKIYRNNLEVIKKRKKYLEDNKDIIKKKYNEWSKRERGDYDKNRRKNDKNFNIKEKLRISLWGAINKYKKTREIRKSRKYGIDYKSIIEHLKPFPKNIKNYQVDHIKPLSHFKFINNNDSINSEQIKEAFAPDNHQWLTIKQHKKKSAKDRKVQNCSTAEGGEWY